MRALSSGGASKDEIWNVATVLTRSSMMKACYGLGHYDIGLWVQPRRTQSSTCVKNMPGIVAPVNDSDRQDNGSNPSEESISSLPKLSIYTSVHYVILSWSRPFIRYCIRSYFQSTTHLCIRTSILTLIQFFVYSIIRPSIHIVINVAT